MVLYESPFTKYRCFMPSFAQACLLLATTCSCFFSGQQCGPWTCCINVGKLRKGRVTGHFIQCFLSFNNLFSNNKICSNQVTMVIHKHILILPGRWRGYNYDHNAMPMQLSPLFRGHSVTMRLWVTGGWRSLEVKGHWRFEVTGGQGSLGWAGLTGFEGAWNLLALA